MLLMTSRHVRFYALATALLVALVSSARAEDAGIAKLFADKKLTGTLVISSLDGKTTYCHNNTRAATRFVPASTFKIPNTLIALEEGAIADGKQILKWDGKDTGLPPCNADQCIETAFRASCLWFYQELAKKVGMPSYAAYMKKLHYGNEQTGPEVTTFWLNGDLKISAIEQIEFLKRLYAKHYDFRPASYELLRNIMVRKQTPKYTLRAKTGWAPGPSPQVGWYVGYVESGEQVWFFATNLDITKPDDATQREGITVDALRLKGLLPQPSE